MLALRFAGKSVYRSGNSSHVVDGRQVDNRRLIAEALKFTLQDLVSLGR